MKKSTKTVIGFFLLAFTVSSCEQMDLEIEVQKCLEGKIKEIKREKISNPPAEVWEWKVGGDIYYYITSNCCDQFNYLYDENCNVVCAPDGGLSGTGDRNCPEFNDQIEKTLLWKDDRKN